MIRSTPMAHMVNCVKLGREAEGLDYPPLPGALGMKIYNNVSQRSLGTVEASSDHDR